MGSRAVWLADAIQADVGSLIHRRLLMQELHRCMEVINRTMTVANGYSMLNCDTDKALSPFNGLLEGIALGQKRSDRCRQGATGAMGVVAINAWSAQQMFLFIKQEHISSIALLKVPPFNQDITRAKHLQVATGFDHFFAGTGIDAGNGGNFRQVWS